jgi:branched-chain amino acid transport system permease protein
VRALKSIKWRNVIPVAIAIFVAILVPFLSRDNRYYMDVFIMLGIYVILGSAMNLLIGYTGQISLGMAGFYGIGAYTSALLCKNFNLPFIVGLLAAIVLCFVVGYILGFPSTKLNFIFLGLSTAGLNTIIQLIITNSAFTGGASGLSGIPRLQFFGEPMNKLQYYYMTLLLTLLTLYICYRIVNTKTGRALKAIRGNPLAAASVGIDVNRYKLLVFAIASAMAGAAGTLYAFNIRYIQADAFTTEMSFKILTMGVIGGMGSLTGGVVGSLVTGALPEFLREFSRYQLMLYGLLTVLVLRFMPGGIIMPFKRIIEKIDAARAARACEIATVPDQDSDASAQEREG